MTGIAKAFGGVPVLRDVDFTVAAGEVHALMGENGAGKSTLMKILGGIHPDHDGGIAIDGRPVRLASPREASRAGIAFIHQELSLVPEMTVAENIFLGREPRRHGVLVDQRRLDADADRLLRQLGVRVRPDARVGDLRVGARQLVEIAKALSGDLRILIMDEPTSALSHGEAETLFAVVRGLASRGVAIIYISHRMEEVAALADRITVLRDGRAVATGPSASLPRRDVIRHMVGRDVEEFYATHRRPAGAVRLEVDGLWLEQPGRARRRLDGVGFSVRAGEILGIGGLLGAGRSEMLEALFGAAEGEAGGTVRVDGQPVKIGSPAAAKAAGLALVTEDRRASGLVLDAGIAENLGLPTLAARSPWGVVRPMRERRLAEAAMARLAIRARGPDQLAGTLSGGNQQKVAIGKWLPAEPKVLLLDEPTRGIDVGAKAEIYRLLAELTAAGLAVVMVSSELPELLSLSDRILVLREGRPTALLDKPDFSAERILDHASPGGAVMPAFARLFLETRV